MMLKKEKFFKGFLIIIFSFSLLSPYLLSAHHLLSDQQLTNTQEQAGEIRKIWDKIPRWQEISSKIRGFWDYTILSKRDSWKERIDSFFSKQYEKQRLIIQKEIEKEKQELIELTPPIIIKTWERLIIIKKFIVRAKEIIENFLKVNQ